MAREHLRECALPGPVRPHDGVHFAGLHLEVDSLEDRVALDRCMKIPNF
jgi:hypothetical protein